MQLTKNFTLEEFKCHDGTDVPVVYQPNVIELAKNLQVLRDFLGQPVILNSGYRTPNYNARQEGSAKHSQHLLAKAADIRVNGISPADLHDIIENLIYRGKMKEGGLGLYNTFVHYDVRGTRARWNFSHG